MEKYLWWYADLDRFYQLLFQASILVGLLAVLTGLGTQNPVFLGVGLLWVAGGVGIVWLMSIVENRNEE